MTNYPDLIPQKFTVFDDGTNAPMSHQRTIASLITGLTIEYRVGRIQYEPLPEIMVVEYNSRYNGPPTPDVVCFNKTSEEASISMEICHSRGSKVDLNKVIGLIKEEYYSIF